MIHNTDSKEDVYDAPGPKGCPFVGSLPSLAWDLLGFFESITRKYGDIVLFKLGRKHIYLISHPKDIERLYAGERKGQYTRKFFHEAYKSAFGNGIFNSYGESWKKQREILQPYFQKRAIETWFPVIREETEHTIQQLAKKNGSEVLHAEQAILPLVQSIMSRILFGKSLEDEDSQQAVMAINTVSQRTVVRSMLAFIFNGVLNRLPTPGNLKYQKALKTINQTINNLKLKAEREGDDKKCLMNQLTPLFDPQELRDHLFTLFFAGQDTTVNAIAFTLYYLGKYPDIQQQARKEVELMMSGKAHLDYQDLKHLQFTESVINESMRLSPPAYATYRDVEGNQKMGNTIIKDKSILVFSPYVTHRHHGVWKNPEQFNPERFINGEIQKLSFMPYGGGMRTCLGLNLARVEILTVVALFLHRFQWTIPDDFKVKFIPHMTLKSRKGIILKMLE
ncbi:MAG: cytochrome P450 [Methylococcaceae bacterium]|nr:cytochrome P450 [Methylococcaceae bacterium]